MTKMVVLSANRTVELGGRALRKSLNYKGSEHAKWDQEQSPVEHQSNNYAGEECQQLMEVICE